MVGKYSYGRMHAWDHNTRQNACDWNEAESPECESKLVNDSISTRLFPFIKHRERLVSVPQFPQDWFRGVETQPTKVDTILSIMTGPFSLVFKLWQLASLTLSSWWSCVLVYCVFLSLSDLDSFSISSRSWSRSSAADTWLNWGPREVFIVP